MTRGWSDKAWVRKVEPNRNSVKSVVWTERVLRVLKLEVVSELPIISVHGRPGDGRTS